MFSADLKRNIQVFAFISLYKVSVCLLGACRGQKTTLDLLELELQVVVMETKLGSSVRASALNHQNIFPAPTVNLSAGFSKNKTLFKVKGKISSTYTPEVCSK